MRTLPKGTPTKDLSSERTHTATSMEAPVEPAAAGRGAGRRLGINEIADRNAGVVAKIHKDRPASIPRVTK